MGRRLIARSTALRVTAGLAVVSLALAGCGSGHPPATTTTKAPVSTTTTVPASGTRVALGTNNPAQGDCATNTPERATAVGYVTLALTASSFVADIHLRSGEPDAVYGVYMQQVPGSCPQLQANAGTLTTNSKGAADFVARIARVTGATTFFVQLVSESLTSEYTSDRIVKGS